MLFYSKLGASAQKPQNFITNNKSQKLKYYKYYHKSHFHPSLSRTWWITKWGCCRYPKCQLRNKLLVSETFTSGRSFFVGHRNPPCYYHPFSQTLKFTFTQVPASWQAAAWLVMNCWKTATNTASVNFPQVLNRAQHTHTSVLCGKSAPLPKRRPKWLPMPRWFEMPKKARPVNSTRRSIEACLSSRRFMRDASF